MSTGDVSSIIALQGALKFNGGGHVNHSLFWENLCPKGSTDFPSSGLLKDAIESRFGNVENMKKELSAMSVGVQGSGWGWLGYDAKTGESPVGENRKNFEEKRISSSKVFVLELLF